MNKLTLPSGDVTIKQAAWLLADAKHPGADKKTRFHNFRWMLNGLLAAVSNGTLRGRIPATGEGIGLEGIYVGDYVQLMVLTPNDIKRLAAERDIECIEPPVKEKPAERRASWLDLLEAEEKKGGRGALQRLADREGVDRSNMGKAIKKAREERAEQRRTGALNVQLVRDGKRIA